MAFLSTILTPIWLLLPYATKSVSCDSYTTELVCATDSSCEWANSKCRCASQAKLDILFGIDTSGSIGLAGFQIQKQFLRTLVTQGINDNARIGFTMFASHVNASRGIQPWIQSELEDYVNYIYWTGGWTNTPAFLQSALSEFNNTYASDRDQILVMITDGNPCLPDAAVPVGGCPISLCDHDPIIPYYPTLFGNAGIRIIIIGVGDGLLPQYVECLTEPDDFIYVASFSTADFSSITGTLSDTLCSAQTNAPTTADPSQPPTLDPSMAPTNVGDTRHPTIPPSKLPTNDPFQPPTATTSDPSISPTDTPIATTFNPSKYPTIDPSMSPTNPPSLIPTKAPTLIPTNAPTTTLQPTSNPTYDFEKCIEEVSLWNNAGAISIEIDTIRKKMRITLRGPTDRWFGIGFGNDAMEDTYAITVSANTIDIKQKKLGNGNGGNDESDTFDSKTGSDVASYRIVSIVRDWKVIGSDIYDFTDFFECKTKVLKIIWAYGMDLNFGYHGNNKNRFTELISCVCEDETTTRDPTKHPVSLSPTAKPTEDIFQSSEANGILLVFNTIIFITCFVILAV